MKLHLIQLTTKCGCKKIVKDPFFNMPKPRYKEPISQPIKSLRGDVVLAEETRIKRCFVRTGKNQTMGKYIIWEYIEWNEE